MYTNVKQHCNSQSQDNFSTLNIILSSCIYEASLVSPTILGPEFDADVLHTLSWDISTKPGPQFGTLFC